MFCLVFQCASKRLHLGKWGHAGLNVSLVAQSTMLQSCECLLRGEVLKPATELAMKKSAICRRARRPVGLFPFLCCSWIRLSNSCLKAWKRRVEQWDNVIFHMWLLSVNTEFGNTLYIKKVNNKVRSLHLFKDKYRIYFFLKIKKGPTVRISGSLFCFLYFSPAVNVICYN